VQAVIFAYEAGLFNSTSEVAGTWDRPRARRQFAALQGGKAWVEDSPGGGASFRVSLPRRTH